MTSELEETLGKQRQQAKLSFDTLKHTASSFRDLQEVDSAYQTYSKAVNKLLTLLKTAQIEEALEVDEKQVDPSYENCMPS
ncbi:MAG: hypothetical protein ACBR50_19345 [Microcoleus sp.]